MSSSARPTKYVFVTGGVVSALGKGIVAAERVLSLSMGVGIRELSVPARVLVVIEDHFPIHLVELVHVRSLWALCSPSTSRSISSGMV